MTAPFFIDVREPEIFMKKQLLLILIFLPFLMLFPENFEFPDTDFMPGWEKSPSIRQFNESSLFNHINGAAELFNEFGFENLHVLRYAKGEEELTLETYRMVNSTAALGIYLMKCGRETPADSQTIRHTVNPFQVLAVRGEVFVQISNASGNPENQSVMLALLSKLAEQIPDSPPKPILDLLPSKNRISGTEKIIRGPYALEPVYTFGEGDVLQLSGKIFAVTGEYMNGGDRYKQISENDS